MFKSSLKFSTRIQRKSNENIISKDFSVLNVQLHENLACFITHIDTSIGHIHILWFVLGRT